MQEKILFLKHRHAVMKKNKEQRKHFEIKTTTA